MMGNRMAKASICSFLNSADTLTNDNATEIMMRQLDEINKKCWKKYQNFQL